MAKDAERRAWLCLALRESDLDAVITPFASEVLLLSGFWPIMASSIAIFTQEGEAHVLVPEDEQEIAQASSDAALAPYLPETLSRLTRAAEAIEAPLGKVLVSLGLSRARIGIQESQGIQPASYAVSTVYRGSLRDMLGRVVPGAQLIGCDQLLEDQKAVRTPLELEAMRRGMRIAADGFRDAFRCIEPGLREPEIAAPIQSAFDTSAHVAEVGRSYGYFFCMSGPNSAAASAAYARTRNRRVEAGDLVMIHANTCADGFWTDITRTFTAGELSERHETMRQAIAEARSAALRSIRPGVPAHEVDRAAREVMQSHGLGAAFRHGLGHGVGYAAANGDALPRLHPLSPDILTEGMTFNIEPAAYFDGYGGMRHCDVVAVTATGVEVLTDF